MEINYLKAKVIFYAPSRGGRPFVPIGDGFAPYIRASGLPHDLAIRINGMPLDGQYETSYEVELELSYHPRVDYSPLRFGTGFQLIEGPRVIGEGFVTSEVFQRPVQTNLEAR